MEGFFSPTFFCLPWVVCNELTCLPSLLFFCMNNSDVFALSIRTIRSNRLRSGITVAIIALGITALVGIITAIQAMNQKLTESFSTMGANGFTIRFKERGFGIGGKRREMDVSRKGKKQEKKIKPRSANNPFTGRSVPELIPVPRCCQHLLLCR
jgi:hypothetical protein